MAARTYDTVPAPTPPEQHRFLLFDVLRGLAAILIVLYHAPLEAGPMFPQSFLAVDLFFVLSGFVIAFSYERRLSGRMSLWSFCLARIFRLYPLYLLGTGLGFLVLLLRVFYFHLRPVLSYLLLVIPALFMMPHFFSRVVDERLYPLDMPAWSLFMELIANLLYAVLVRLRIANWVILLAISIGSLLGLALTSPSHSPGWTFPSLEGGLFRVGYSFFAGVLICKWYKRVTRPRLRGTSAILLAAFVTVGMLGCLMVPIRPDHDHNFVLIVSTIIFPLLLWLAAKCELPDNWGGFTSFLGNISYPIYVMHFPILYLVSVAEHFKLARFAGVLTFTVVVLLIPLSWWIVQFYDTPVRRYLAARF